MKWIVGKWKVMNVFCGINSWFIDVVLGVGLLVRFVFWLLFYK